MKFISTSKAKLVLSDGTVFEGFSLGVKGITTGEMCFNTGMTGYQEIYTDPSYKGQIIINTTSHIGNYGIKNGEEESNNVQFSGLVCNTFSNIFSRFQSEYALNNYFLDNNIIGISGVDTRKLVRYIRSKGSMNGIISNDNLDENYLKNKLLEVPSMHGLELSSTVSTKNEYFFGNPDAKFKLAVLDLGIKKNILRNFEQRDCF